MQGRVAEDSAVPVVPATRDSRVAGEHGVATFELMLVALIGVLVLAIAMPALLRTSPAANDTDARANLANAIDSAKAAYFVGQSYSWEGAALSPLSFDSQDPAFSWITGSCAGQSPACVSEQVVDVDSPGDAQGVVIAVWSSATRKCWYAADLQSVPRSLPEDRSGVPFDSRPGTVGAQPEAGVYYAKSDAGVSSCSARSAVGSSEDVTHWSPNPSEAGVIG
jgi:type II secretory pathway pseudopilin PulG